MLVGLHHCVKSYSPIYSRSREAKCILENSLLDQPNDQITAGVAILDLKAFSGEGEKSKLTHYH